MANSVEKTMIILRAIADSKDGPITPTRLSEKTGINISTLSHILRVLQKEGYVKRVSHNEGYTVGPELFFLTRYGRFGEEITSSCHSILEYINKQTGGTALFSVLHKGRKYIIDYVEGHVSYKDSGATILSDDLYRTVTGRKLLAALPTFESLEVFRSQGVPEPSTWDEVKDEESFIRELQKLSQTEIYVRLTTSRGRRLLSIATIINKNAKPVASLGLAVLADKVSEEAAVELIRRCKKEIERRLNFA